MQLFTPVEIKKASRDISHDTPVLLLGSCFSDSMAERMQAQLFDVTANPLGTLYNPVSIRRCLEVMTSRAPFTEADLTQHGGLYHSFLCHSSLSRTTADETLLAINSALAQGAQALRRASHIFLTLGTAMVYRLHADGSVVANCHKMPQQLFDRHMLSVDEAAEALQSCIAAIRAVNPSAEIWLTVSPIRHLSDGAHTNTLSKSTLHLAASRIAEARYFPAYEIVCDELRDYRFYASDMAHPSPVAADIVYEKFADCFYSEATKTAARDCAKLVRRLAHRRLTANQEEFDRFRANTLNLADEIILKYPSVEGALRRLLPNHKFSS